MAIWEYAEDLLDALSFAIEFVIFTLFIYEEALQIHNRLVLDQISGGSRQNLQVMLSLNMETALANMLSFYNNYGILALYGCNAYANYIYVTYMTWEWAKIYTGGGRQTYSVHKTGLFGTV